MAKEHDAEGVPSAADRSEDAPDPTPVRTEVTSAPESIRSNVLWRVLPMIAVPMLILGVAFVLALTVIEARTASAIRDAEEVLTDEIAPDTVNSAAERVSQQLAVYLTRRADALQVITSRRQFRQLIPTSGPVSVEVLETGAELLEAEGVTPLMLLVDLDGNTRADMAGRTANYAGAEWFIEAVENGQSVTAYHLDGDRGYSFAETIETVNGEPAGVIQARYPLSTIQTLVDEIVVDDPVAVAVIDGETGIMLAETESGHDPLYINRPALDAIALDVDTSLLDPDDPVLRRENSTSDGVTIVSARSLGVFAGAAGQFNWIVQARQPVELATAPLAEVRQVADDVGNTQNFLTLMVGVLLALALVLGYRAARKVADRITDPVAQLSNQAQLAATQGIPAVVDAAKNSAEELPELLPFRVETRDELSVLANSLNTMQDAAVHLAAGQAQLRRQNVARTFVSLGRRNQNLINRQLEFITQLEQNEDDADTLQNLFRLDHLATRMRRNAENLLVLAGEKTPRRWAKPIAIRDVIRAAASEIGDYRRVRISDLDDATVSGNLATDLSHLLAELLENAGTFSPPNSPIDVLGQRTETHYRLAIIDQGIGMDPAALAEANDRLANPADFSDAPSAYLGLFVVGHLARQLNITVRLANSEPVNVTSSESGGTIAFIDLPVSVLSTDAATPVDVPDRAQAPPRPEDIIKPGATPTWQVPDDDVAAPDVQEQPVETTAAGFPKRGGGTEAPATTAAGFPKRGRGGPPASPAAEAGSGFPGRVAPMVAEPPPVDAPAPGRSPADVTAPISSPQPDQTRTAAGFPKRRGADTAPIADTTPARVAAEPGPPDRNPDQVRSSLASFHDAVARGRAAGKDAEPIAGPSSGESAPDSPESADPRTPRRDHQ